MGIRRADFYPKMYILVYARYIELNPVRAGLAKKPEAWPLSSAGPHIESRDDLPVKTKPLCTLVQKSWREFWHMTFRNRTSNGYGNTNGLDGHWEGMRLLKKRNYFVYQSKLRCFLSRDELTGEQHLQDFLAAHCPAQRHHWCGTKKPILTPGVAKRASSAAIARSHAATSLQPAAAALPCTATITVCGISDSKNIIFIHTAKILRYVCRSLSASSCKSYPAENIVPVP